MLPDGGCMQKVYAQSSQVVGEVRNWLFSTHPFCCGSWFSSASLLTIDSNICIFNIVGGHMTVNFSVYTWRKSLYSIRTLETPFWLVLNWGPETKKGCLYVCLWMRSEGHGKVVETAYDRGRIHRQESVNRATNWHQCTGPKHLYLGPTVS